MKHIFFIDNDKLICQKFRSLYTGNINTYKCVFRIKSDVQGLTWFCVFKHGDLIRQTEIVNNSCMIPHELLSNKGTLSIGCYAVNPDENNYKRISTGWVNINLKTGAYSVATAPDIPSPDVWETLILKSVPYIGDNGNWFIYSLEANAYIDSGVSASGGGGGSPVNAYTKSETDKLLDNKADKADVYTKEEIDEGTQTVIAEVSENFVTQNLFEEEMEKKENVSNKVDVDSLENTYGEQEYATARSVSKIWRDVTETIEGISPGTSDRNIELSEENEQPVYGEELINTAVWTLGEGWSGDVSSGFTHAATNASDYGESLTCNIGNTGNKLYEIQLSSSVDFTSTNILISVGNSDYAQLYGQGKTTSLGIRSVSDGVIEFKVENKYAGTLTITSIREITGASTPTNVIIDSEGKNTVEYRYSKEKDKSLFIGRISGRYNDSAQGNIGVGDSSLSNNVSGFWNVGIGYNSLQNNTAGSRNVGIGYITLQQNTVGCRNIAIGSFALKSNTSGSWNIAIGADSMDHNTTGEKNTAVGFSTLYYNTTGKQNAAFGANALGTLTTGNNNVGVGVGAGSGIKTGSGNMAVGYGSLSNIDSGSNNVAIGTNALYRCKGGGQNVAIGQGAGMGASGNSMQRNVFIGANTANKLSGAARENVVLGFNSAQSLVTGNRNIILGAYCEVGESINNALNIGNLITGNMASGSKSVTVDGTLTVNNIPTSDPNVAGQIWNDNGTLKVSAGV